LRDVGFGGNKTSRELAVKPEPPQQYIESGGVAGNTVVKGLAVSKP